MDRVGFEPTTSAHQQLFGLLLIIYLNGRAVKRENCVLFKSHPIHLELEIEK
jgi:hypothetical protein